MIEFLCRCSVKDATGFLDDVASKLIAFVYCGSQIIWIQGELGEESSHERITGAIRINDCCRVDWCDWNEFNGDLLARATSRHNSWVSTLSDYDNARALSVGLLIGSDDLGSTLAVVCLKAIGRGEGGTLVLIAEHEVGVLDCVIDGICVELDHEEGRQVEAERLVIVCGEVAESFDGGSI